MRAQEAAARRLVSEALGTALLVAAVVGSGIMAERLARDPGVALLCNTLATAGALVAILLVFGPISGAHLNPAVTLLAALERQLSPRLAAGYVAAQGAGGVAGAWLANAMFELPVLSLSSHARGGGGAWLAEVVATFGLVGVVIVIGRTRAAVVPLAVAAYIAGAYWFTSSTSFANPAVTLARAFSDSYAGIRLVDVPAFAAAQLVGALLGRWCFGWLAADEALAPAR